MIRRVRTPVAWATQGGELIVVRPRPARVPYQSGKLRIARVPALIRGALLAALLVAVSFPSARAGNPIERGNRRPVKVMIISTFGPERQVWLDRLEPWRAITVPGLAPDYPDVHCNQSKICVFTTGMGHSNAAASVTALVFSGLFELSHTYFIVAAVAGIDPAQGTLGSAAWARYLVELGLQWEIDAREIPPDWTTGYLGIDTTGPTQKPPLEYRTEVFQLNEALLRRAYALTRAVPLADSAQAQATRAKFNDAPANQPPSILQCDTVSGDTWFSGALLTQRARLDQDPHRRQGYLLHLAAGGQRHLRGAEAGRGRQAPRPGPCRRAARRLRLPPAARWSIERGQPRALRCPGWLPDRARKPLSGRQSAGAGDRQRLADVASGRPRPLAPPPPTG